MKKYREDNHISFKSVQAINKFIDNNNKTIIIFLQLSIFLVNFIRIINFLT